MSLRELDIKKFYNSDGDKPLEDFYIPVLGEAILYKRITFSFSSGILAKAARGVAGLLKNGGRMQLLASIELQERDYEAMKSAVESPERYLNDLLEKEIGDVEQFLRNKWVDALAWMLANELLEVRIGVVPGNISHMKIGLICDAEGNKLSFSGSNNETPSGWEHNVEEFKVFRGWVKEESDWYIADEKKFDDLWDGRGQRMLVYKLPEAISKKLIHARRGGGKPKIVEAGETVDIEENNETKTPISLSEIQVEALQNWFVAGKRGMYEMATGTGKTIAAIGTLSRLIEQNNKLLCVISAPYTHLVKQWQNEIEHILKHGDDKDFQHLKQAKLKIITATTKLQSDWKADLSNSLLQMELGLYDVVVVLVTHTSLSSEFFMSKIVGTDFKKVIIADEAHGLGSADQRKGLLPEYQYRLALSATPSRWFDNEGTQLLLDYFGEKVYGFTLEDALTKINPRTGATYLTPYKYFPQFVRLTNDEMVEYIQLSKRIARLYHQVGDDPENVSYQMMLEKRAKIIKDASGKTEILSSVLHEIFGRQGNYKHTLIYVNPGEQFQYVKEQLQKLSIRFRQFTFNESEDERTKILKQFSEGVCEVVLSMKCLDEGVDIPYAVNAIIMASSTNPREFIQRRGRVLRRAVGKNEAYIYDLIVTGNTEADLPDKELQEQSKKILEREMMRYKDFANSAKNSADCLLVLLDQFE